MTKKEANEWLKEVTGRKIRLDYWSECEYAIPTGEWRDTSDDSPYCWLFWCIDEKGEKYWCYVCNGFKNDLCGFNWEFVETVDDYYEDKDRLEDLNNLLLAHLILKGVYND